MKLNVNVSEEKEMEEKKVTFIVPGEPQGKGRPRSTIRGGHVATYTPQKTVSYEGTIAVAAQMAMRGQPLFDGPCAVSLNIFMSVPASWSRRKRLLALGGDLLPTKKPDADNIEKVVFDAMNGVVWRDDSQVVDSVKHKRYSDTPCVHVIVSEIGAAP
jgi:Holliday junction resolvase RusA-like endonuclease